MSSSTRGKVALHTRADGAHVFWVREPVGDRRRAARFGSDRAGWNVEKAAAPLAPSRLRCVPPTPAMVEALWRLAAHPHRSRLWS